MVESECWECVRVCTHRRWTAEGECAERVLVRAPTGDGRPNVSECAERVRVCTHWGWTAEGECVERVRVCTHWGWTAEGV